MNRGLVIISNDEKYEYNIIQQEINSDIIKNIVVVYSKKNELSKNYLYFIDNLNIEYKIIPFEDYINIENLSYIEKLDLTKTLLIVKNYNSMLKRLDKRLDFIQSRHEYVKKIIIDELPFIQHIWKYYFPFSFFDKRIIGYSHSYALERDYNNFKEGLRDNNPCLVRNLVDKTKGFVKINYEKYFNFNIQLNEYKVSDKELNKYNEIKEYLFNTENNINSIIKKLQKYSKTLIKNYNLPSDIKKIYTWKNEGLFNNVIINKTDLKVDNYLYNEIINLIEQTNNLTELLYRYNNEKIS